MEKAGSFTVGTCAKYIVILDIDTSNVDVPNIDISYIDNLTNTNTRQRKSVHDRSQPCLVAPAVTSVWIPTLRLDVFLRNNFDPPLGKTPQSGDP